MENTLEQRLIDSLTVKLQQVNNKMDRMEKLIEYFHVNNGISLYAYDSLKYGLTK